MEGWKQTKTIRYGSCTINIYRPELTRAEQAKREQAARETLGREMRDYLQRKDSKA